MKFKSLKQERFLHAKKPKAVKWQGDVQKAPETQMPKPYESLVTQMDSFKKKKLGF